MSEDLFFQYFLKSGGYNPINTTVYSIILIAFVLLIFKLLKKLKVKFDKRLALAVSPFVFLGSSMRVLEDSGILQGYLFITPGIYFLIFGVTISILLISLFLEKKKGIPYFKPMFIVGLILTFPILGILQYKNFLGVFYITLYFIPWLIILKVIPWLKENKVVTGAHLFDANTTFVSMNYFGYYEQHVVPTYLINLSGTSFSFVILKFIALITILYVIDKYSDDKEFNNYIKLIIGILGAATGIRGFLRLFALV
jgi:uncharacterized membrane protein